MKKVKKYFPYFYVLFLISTFFYVRNILDTESVDVGGKKENPTTEEIKPVRANLEIYKDGVLQNSYSKRMQNINSFDDLLEELRKEGFVYEKTDYIRGTEYEYINRQETPDGYIWKVYVNDEDYTYKTNEIKLNSDSTYKLVLEKDE